MHIAQCTLTSSILCAVCALLIHLVHTNCAAGMHRRPSKWNTSFYIWTRIELFTMCRNTILFHKMKSQQQKTVWRHNEHLKWTKVANDLYTYSYLISMITTNQWDLVVLLFKIEPKRKQNRNKTPTVFILVHNNKSLFSEFLAKDFCSLKACLFIKWYPFLRHFKLRLLFDRTFPLCLNNWIVFNLFYSMPSHAISDDNSEIWH